MSNQPIGAGDFVECISAAGARKLRRGKIYRVSDVVRGPCSCCGGDGLRIDGVKPSRPYSGFHAIRFRPVYRPDPSWLQALLQDIRVSEVTLDLGAASLEAAAPTRRHAV